MQDCKLQGRTPGQSWLSGLLLSPRPSKNSRASLKHVDVPEKSCCVSCSEKKGLRTTGCLLKCLF